MTRFTFLPFLVICLSCKERSVQQQTISKDSQINSRGNHQDLRLGESNYFIRFPDNFTISEARGKEGQLGYNIIPKDTSSTMLGFIEIRRGNSIGDNLIDDTKAKVFTSSYLLDRKVGWKIYQTETGYYNAFTSEKGDLNASASSKKRNEVDSLISLISTLKRK